MTVPDGCQRCRTCGKVKRLDEFHKKRANKNGRDTRCRVCSTRETLRRQAEERTRMGDEAYLAHKREIQRRARAKPGVRESQRAAARASGRALWRLADVHRGEFDAILTEERVREGLSPVPYERSGYRQGA